MLAKLTLISTLITVALGDLAARQNDFLSCLGQTSGVVVLTSSSPDYASASLAYNRRVTFQPAAIVYPSTTQQVSSVVSCAAGAGMSVSSRSGGHSYAGYGLAGNLVIDLKNMTSLTVDQSTGKAVSQTGNRLGDLAQGIWNQGQRALPHGTCPYVGSGGHALFGGFGYFSRKAGLLLDRISSAEVVLANGTVVTASSSQNSDLFWALRGAGASYGVVTAWTFDTLPAPTNNVVYTYTMPTQSQSTWASTFLAIQTFAATAPNELALGVTLGSPGDGSISMTVQGTYYGTQDQFNSVVAQLVNKFPQGFTSSVNQLNWIDGLVAVDGQLSTLQPDIHDTFFAKSLMTPGPLSSDAINSWASFLYSQATNAPVSWFAIADLYGGAIASVAEDATAYANRNAFWTFQLYGFSSNSEPPFPDAGFNFIGNMLNSLSSNPQEAYPNYVDPTLSTSQWQSQYYGSHYTRLSQIKGSVDPNNVFNFPQAIIPSQ